MMDSLLAPDSLGMPGLVIRATILLSAALALAWLARKGAAGVRHLLWTMTFALLLGLPVLSLLGPSWDVPILPSSGSPAPQRPPPLMEAPAVDVATDARVTLAAPDTPLPEAGSAAVAVADPVSPPRSIPLAILLWGIGCTAALASLGVGAVRCARLVRAASPLRDPIGLRHAEAVRRPAGDSGRRPAPRQPDGHDADDGRHMEAGGPASDNRGRVVQRAVEGRADA